MQAVLGKITNVTNICVLYGIFSGGGGGWEEHRPLSQEGRRKGGCWASRGRREESTKAEVTEARCTHFAILLMISTGNEEVIMQISMG